MRIVLMQPEKRTVLVVTTSISALDGPHQTFLWRDLLIWYTPWDQETREVFPFGFFQDKWVLIPQVKYYYHQFDPPQIAPCFVNHPFVTQGWKPPRPPQQDQPFWRPYSSWSRLSIVAAGHLPCRDPICNLLASCAHDWRLILWRVDSWHLMQLATDAIGCSPQTFLEFFEKRRTFWLGDGYLDWS